MHTYTALFDKREDAEHAQAELKKLGIVPADNVNLADKDTKGFAADRSADNRSFWQSLKDVFVPDDDRQTYEEGVRQGSWLLTVNVDDQSSQRVHDLLESSNAVNIDEREEQYRKAGHLTDRATARATGEQTVPVIQEELRVGKRRVEQGGVRVRSYIVSTPVQKDVNLVEERVVVERRPVNERVDASELGDALRDRSVEVTTRKEEAVVSKEARVVEEISLKKNVDERVERVDATVRHTEVEVENLGTKDKR